MGTKLRVSREEAEQKIKAQIRAGKKLQDREVHLRVLHRDGDNRTQRLIGPQLDDLKIEERKWVKNTETVLADCFTDKTASKEFRRYYDMGPSGSVELAIVNLGAIIWELPSIVVAGINRGAESSSGITWKSVAIEFVSRDSIRVKVGQERPHTLTFAEAGFKDGRKGDLPDTRWSVLELFARHRGEVPWNVLRDELDVEVKKAVGDIRKRLKTLVGLKEDPIRYDRRKNLYRTLFSISDQRRGEGAALDKF